ncbi:hypothetical protein D3C87_2114620 [compost metagenome]
MCGRTDDLDPTGVRLVIRAHVFEAEQETVVNDDRTPYQLCGTIIEQRPAFRSQRH